jgi:ABC-type multidrug transport system permease subunit
MLFNFIAQGLIMGSVFLNMPNATSAYFSRGGTLFFAVLFGAMSSMAEIPALYAQRPIVSRHHKAALYHPFIDSLALTIVDIVKSFVSSLDNLQLMFFCYSPSLHLLMLFSTFLCIS